MDPRYTQLAKLLLTYCVQANAKSKIWVRVNGLRALRLGREVYTEAVKLGATPYLDISDEASVSSYFREGSLVQMRETPDAEEFLVQWADQIITLVGEENTRALADIDPQKFVIRTQMKQKIREVTLRKPWVLTWVPTPALAQDAGIGTKEFEDFYFQATLRDWKQEGKRYTSLATLLSKANQIEIIGDRTHLQLSTTGRPFVADNGECNMPGGEVFSSPIENSAQGEIYFEFPLLRFGKLIRDIQCTFRQGKIVSASASENQALLEQMLDTDPGARYLGEFAIGMNPAITRYMYNTLFDEKIQGTIHLAFGQAFAECKGKNVSAMHVDIVKDMRKPGSLLRIDGRTILDAGKLTF